MPLDRCKSMPTLAKMVTILAVALGPTMAASCSDSGSGTKNVGGAGDTSLFGETTSFSDSSGVDTSGLGDTAAAEVAPDPGTFGASCKGNSDCDSSYCVQAPNGKVCTRTCVEDCPGDWECVEKKGADNDVTYLCVPRFLSLCDPCTNNAQCNEAGKSGNVCVSFGSAGSFCGVACDEVSPNCPTDYSCQAVVDPKTGLSTHQCLRETGLCTCSQKAIDLALETTCTNQNINGTCTGARVCGVGGLGACQAAVPAAEVCNSIDDDCNGKTDDFQTGVAKCDKTNEFGTCPGKVLECVDGKPLCDAPDAKPEQCNGIDDNCNGKTDEGICDDGQDCTVDSCDSAGGCIHKGVTGIQCSDDGDTCTNDVCNADGQCVHKPVAGVACDDGSICTQTDKCLAGTCVGGNALDCNDNDPCTADGCDPFTGCTHTPASDAVCTDDGNPCTLDQCQSGQCVHKPNEGGACTDDGKPCTLDVCANGVCTHPQSQGACEDGNPCTENDLCKGGACQAGPIKACDDGSQCTKDSCDPTKGCLHDSQSMDYKPCVASSGDCPVGACSGGSCFSKPNESCQTKVKIDLCGSVDALGTCTAAGKCVAKSLPQGYTCPNCKSICLKCQGIPICMDLFFGIP